VDWIKTFEIAQDTPVKDHHKKCSYRQTNGSRICDCEVLTNHPEYKDDMLQGAGGKTCFEETL
jgi:hypothetical protein